MSCWSRMASAWAQSLNMSSWQLHHTATRPTYQNSHNSRHKPGSKTSNPDRHHNKIVQSDYLCIYTRLSNRETSHCKLQSQELCKTRCQLNIQSVCRGLTCKDRNICLGLVEICTCLIHCCSRCLGVFPAHSSREACCMAANRSTPERTIDHEGHLQNQCNALWIAYAAFPLKSRLRKLFSYLENQRGMHVVLRLLGKVPERGRENISLCSRFLKGPIQQIFERSSGISQRSIFHEFIWWKRQ